MSTYVAANITKGFSELATKAPLTCLAPHPVDIRSTLNSFQLGPDANPDAAAASSATGVPFALIAALEAAELKEQQQIEAGAAAGLLDSSVGDEIADEVSPYILEDVSNGLLQWRQHHRHKQRRLLADPTEAAMLRGNKSIPRRAASTLQQRQADGQQQQQLGEMDPFAGSCSCWSCPVGTRTGPLTQPISGARCLPAFRVRNAMELAVTVSSSKGCSRQGSGALTAAVRAFLREHGGVIRSMRMTCGEQPMQGPATAGRLAAAAAAGQVVPAGGAAEDAGAIGQANDEVAVGGEVSQGWTGQHVI